MNYHLITTALRKSRTSWVVLVGLLLLALPLLRGGRAWAATIRDINQTVPPPTATRAPTPIPPATATPKPPSSQPTATPKAGGNSSSPSTPTATALPTTTKKLTGTVKARTLNVRSGPGTNYGVIATLLQGAKVDLLQQTEKGDWWFICCAPGTDMRGWVSSTFVTPDSDLAEVKRLLPIANEIPAVLSPTPTGEVTTTVTTNQDVVVPLAGTAIQVSMTQSPSFPLQGDLVTLAITVTNPTTATALDVELRDELPMGMTLVEVTAAQDSSVLEDLTENLRDVYSVAWPTLEAGDTVTATAKVQIAADLLDGAVLDNLAFAGASNIPGTTAGFSIGMPPTDVPDFQ